MEDEFTESDWFAWPAGHTDYADLSVNKDPESENEDEDLSEDENPDGK